MYSIDSLSYFFAIKEYCKYGWSFSKLFEAMRGLLDEPYKPTGDLITEETQELLSKAKSINRDGFINRK